MVVLQFILMAIVFGPTVSSLSLTPKEFPFLKTQMNDETHATAFNKLLNSIVKTSQKRLDTIKKLNKLQATDIHPSLEDPLRTRRDSDESSEETDVIYLVIPDTPVPSTDHNKRSISKVPTSPSTRPPSQPNHPPERSVPQNPTLQDLSKLKAVNPSPSSDASRNSSIHSLSKDGLDALRVSIARSCRSQEVKKCRKACKAAVKSACEEYSCKKKLKRRLKKNCKKECKEEFRNSDRW